MWISRKKYEWIISDLDKAQKENGRLREAGLRIAGDVQRLEAENEILKLRLGRYKRDRGANGKFTKK